MTFEKDAKGMNRGKLELICHCGDGHRLTAEKVLCPFDTEAASIATQCHPEVALELAVELRATEVGALPERLYIRPRRDVSMELVEYTFDSRAQNRLRVLCRSGGVRAQRCYEQL